MDEQNNLFNSQAQPQQPMPTPEQFGPQMPDQPMPTDPQMPPMQNQPQAQDPNQQPQGPAPIQPQTVYDMSKPADPIDPHGVGLQSPILTPNQFDGLKPIPVPGQIPDPNQQKQTQAQKPKKDLTPEQMTKRFMILSIVLGVLAIIGIGLGIFGLVDAANTRDELATAKSDLATKNAIVAKIEQDTDKKITTVETVPDYAPVIGNIYISEWNLKIKIDPGLANVSYILDQKYRPQICFAAHQTGLTQFPSFADIDLNPNGMGCLTRIKTSEGNMDENGVSFGDKVFTYGEYSYFYWKDPSFVFSESDADKGLEATGVELIKNMLTTAGNIEHYE